MVVRPDDATTHHTYQLEAGQTLLISYAAHASLTGTMPLSCSVTLVQGSAQVQGQPLVLLQEFQPNNLRDVVIDVLSDTILYVLTDRFCVISDHSPSINRQPCRLVELKKTCTFEDTCVYVASCTTTAVIETLSCEYELHGVAILVIDLDHLGSAFTPRYVIGSCFRYGNSQTWHTGQQYFHSRSNRISDTVYTRISREISDFQKCGGFVLINGFSCRYDESYPEIRRVISLLSVSRVIAVNVPDIFVQVQRMYIPTTRLLPWPELRKNPSCAFEATQGQPLCFNDVISRVRGLFRYIPVAPDSCLPIGYTRLLKHTFLMVSEPTSLEGTFGITQVVPSNENLETISYDGLVRCGTKQMSLLVGSLPDTGDLYVVTWTGLVTFCAKM